MQVRIKSLTPSRLLFVTGPGSTGKSFLIHTVVGHLTLCQGKFVEVLASSGSAACLLGGKIVHRFFRLGVNLEYFILNGELLTAVWLADVLIIDELQHDISRSIRNSP